jgi:hypothetical protein
LKRDCRELGGSCLRCNCWVTFSVSLDGVCHELDTLFHYELISSLEGPSCDLKNFLSKAPSKLGLMKF